MLHRFCVKAAHHNKSVQTLCHDISSQSDGTYSHNVPLLFPAQRSAQHPGRAHPLHKRSDQNLSDPSKLGEGIAVAFVATIYGLVAANLYMLPCFNRIKNIYGKIFLSKNVIIEGVLAIQAGESPTLISRKLGSFILGVSSKGMENNG